jgi:hypothetical protein
MVSGLLAAFVERGFRVRRDFPGLRKLFLFAGDMAIVAAASDAAMFIVTAYSGAKIDQALCGHIADF